MDYNEADRHSWWGQVGITAWQRTEPVQFEGKWAVISQITTALLRAVLVAGLLAAPSLLLPTTATDTAQLVVVLAILASFMTFIEYYSRYPSLVEFRFAPPINRIKFIGLASTVLLLTFMLRGMVEPTGWSVFLWQLGTGLGEAIDFPYSPVRLVVLMLPVDADSQLVASVRTAAGLSYTISILMIFVFITAVRMFGWPLRNGAFNVWVNLPLFDPTGGGDVLHRLKRDAGLNIVLGSLLPFLIPAAIKAASDLIDPISIAHPQTLIWTITAWAFLPASMLMRGVAMSRIAEMIEEKRNRTYARAETEAEALHRA